GAIGAEHYATGDGAESSGLTIVTIKARAHLKAVPNGIHWIRYRHRYADGLAWSVERTVGEGSADLAAIRVQGTALRKPRMTARRRACPGIFSRRRRVPRVRAGLMSPQHHRH